MVVVMYPVADIMVAADGLYQAAAVAGPEEVAAAADSVGSAVAVLVAVVPVEAGKSAFFLYLLLITVYFMLM